MALKDLESAKAIAKCHLDGLAKTGLPELIILDEHTQETDFGWVFFWNSKQYEETGDFRFALAGNAPLIVDRRDASVHMTSTSLPVEEIIESYRKSHSGTLPRD